MVVRVYQSVYQSISLSIYLSHTKCRHHCHGVIPQFLLFGVECIIIIMKASNHDKSFAQTLSLRAARHKPSL